MSKSPAWWVFRKEMREILRDKRVRTGAVVTPIFVVIMMVAVFGIISASVGKGTKQKVTIVRTSSPLASVLKSDAHLKVTEVGSEAEGRSLIQKGKTNLVASITGASGGRSQVNLLYDPKEESSEVAKSALKSALEPTIQSSSATVLHAHGLSKQDITPVDFKDVPVVVGEGAGAGSIIVGILPYLMVLFTFTGGFSIAADMVAGEKEKNTLETLLITPVHRTQVVMGKFFSIAAVCMVSALSSVLGLLLTAVLHLPGSEVMFGGGFGLTPVSVAVILVALLPLVALFAGLLVAVSSYARNVREAQTMLSTVNLVILVPAILSQVIGYTEFAHSNAVNFVPVLGTAMNIREAFQGKSSWLFTGESFLTGAVLAAVMLFVAVRLFVREQVLVRI